MSETTQVETEKKVEGKTVMSLKLPTPMWATWVFRIFFILTGIATFIIAADPGIQDDTKVRLGIYLKGADMLIWGVTRAIGVEVTRDLEVK
jgi:hypothetical protein